MRLYEFKTKYMTALSLYEPRTEREKALRDVLISKLVNLRYMSLPNLVFSLYEIIEHEKDVSDTFRRICKMMLEDISLIKKEEEED